MQASRTISGEYYGVIYGDTEDANSLYGGCNAKPNLYMATFSIQYPQFSFPEKMTTEGTYWFHYSSNIAKLINGYMFNTLYIPTTTMINQVEMLVNSELDPVTIEYVDLPVFPNVNENLLNNRSILISPNPTNTFTQISFKNIKHHNNIMLEVLDIMGKPITQQTIQKYQTETTINVESWEKGIYFVVVWSGGEVVGKEKFVVK